MASVNKVILVGNLGKDPEVRYTAGGDPIANFSIACTESWKDKQTGEKKEMTEWVRISVFGKLAEICGQYLKKGSQVYIEGSLRTRKWTDKDGVERYTTEIRADQMKMLGGKQEGDGPSRGDTAGRSGERARQDPPQGGSNPSSGFGNFDDDIPFNKLGAGRQHLVI